MPQSVTVKFVDFWKDFQPDNNKFVSALRAHHDVTVLPADSPATPDILFFSRDDSMHHLDYDGCVKIYFTGENDVPDFNECDYAISFHHLNFGERHLRYPLYMLYQFDEAVRIPALTVGEATGREFCSLLMRNDYNCDPRRLRIIDAVDAYRPLAYGGPFRNNIGGCVAEKIPFIRNYKFNLALENSSVEGYVTEKIVEPFAAATIPIYWGAPDIAKDFNPQAFINVDDYDSMDAFIAALSHLDNDTEAYMEMLTAPRLTADIATDFDSHLIDFLDNIVATRRRYTTSYGEAGRYHRRSLLMRPFVNSRNFMRIAKGINKLKGKGR
ncbi:MAG: glycosyltransferase [Bacteroides sp.]|nr:glycosyltransferase [Bacteroides sp.]